MNTIIVATGEETGAQAMRENLSGALAIVRPLAEEISVASRPRRRYREP
ncbi:MAG: hypothetical protein AVDCRST_MAG78-2226 [uncultured Rubrobacteraceae bacterium]|uniref:Uncharacterized protein n=1 Tax=uncultured Rubrobacteraceae bacterium TaxID=349277 RepID=A0A6J4QAP6_9ACTN|nr:MAG: hypothetical protein AVDCRST_MAG78-2226 [uncultured Rubrobacteraceae bacterium]